MQDVVYGNKWDEKFKNASECTGNAGIKDAWCGQLSDENVTTSRRYYHANINFVDEQIGVILEALESKGEMNNTIFLFTSDHGDMQSDHYLWRKGYGYEGSTHVPMIMSWPDSLKDKLNISFEKGFKSDKIVELRDVFPTFLELAGGD